MEYFKLGYLNRHQNVVLMSSKCLFTDAYTIKTAMIELKKSFPKSGLIKNLDIDNELFGVHKVVKIIQNDKPELFI